MSAQFPLPGLPEASATPEEEGGPKKRRRPSREELLEGLNEPQREAVIHEGSPLLVVAGAGSGKTRVLTRRIAWIVSQRKAHPGSILAITFTNKAAAEMKERVEALVGKRARIMWVSTFHSACVRILRKEIDKLGFKSSFSIYDAADSKRLMTLVLKDLDRLTEREREVMRLIARGYAYKEVARELFISIKTVETHMSSVLRKLQLSSRHELTRWASDRRLL
jgi:DNA helicase-2/ATP-dependent DNA helicase PcrA